MSKELKPAKILFYIFLIAPFFQLELLFIYGIIFGAKHPLAVDNFLRELHLLQFGS